MRDEMNRPIEPEPGTFRSFQIENGVKKDQ